MNVSTKLCIWWGANGRVVWNDCIPHFCTYSKLGQDSSRAQNKAGRNVPDFWSDLTKQGSCVRKLLCKKWTEFVEVKCCRQLVIVFYCASNLIVHWAGGYADSWYSDNTSLSTKRTSNTLLLTNGKICSGISISITNSQTLACANQWVADEVTSLLVRLLEYHVGINCWHCYGILCMTKLFTELLPEEDLQ